MTKKTNKNLKQIQSTEEAREKGRKGGIKSGEVRRARKTLKQELLALLSTGDTQKRISTALLDKALTGDTKAFEVIRDTIGEKPTEKVIATNTDIEVKDPKVIDKVINKIKDL